VKLQAFVNSFLLILFINSELLEKLIVKESQDTKSHNLYTESFRVYTIYLFHSDFVPLTTKFFKKNTLWLKTN